MATIGINILFLVPNQVGGTEYLTRSFIDALTSDLTHEYVLFCNLENADTFPARARLRKVVCPVRASNRLARILYEQLRLPALVSAQRCDLLHSFGYTAPYWSRVPQVTTVHDANWLDHPEDFSWISRLLTDILVRAAIRTSQIVVTDSLFSQVQLGTHFPESKKKIVVVRPIIDQKLYEPPFVPLPEELRQTPYILCVSAFYPHKRIPYLLQLWQTPTPHTLPRLVLVGRHGGDQATVAKLLATAERVSYYPKVSFALLKTLYHHAALFIHPSVYEGFGLPVYEAFGAGLLLLLGRADLYDPAIQEVATALSFDRDRDRHFLERIRSRPRRPRTVWKKRDSLLSLLAVYDHILATPTI